MKLVQQRSVLGGLGEINLCFVANGLHFNGDEFAGVRNQIRAEFLKNPEVTRFFRLHDEMAGHEKTLALAAAKLEEIKAIRARVVLESSAGLAKQLLSLDQEYQQIQKQVDEAREQISVLEPHIEEAQAGLQPILSEVTKRITRPAVKELLAKRQAIVAEVESVIAPKIEAMDALGAAIMQLERPGCHPIALAELLKGE